MVVFSNPPPAYSPDSDDMPIENIIYRSKLNLIPPSKIEVYDRNHVPQDLQGALTIVIDVLAATSNIGDFLNAGANLLLTDDSTILDAMKRMPEALIIGETLNNELRPKIPFYSWHPPHILQRDQVLKQLEGKDLLYLTNNGTKVVHEVSAANPAQVITSSFPYLGSTIRYAQGAFEANNVERIVIVSSGEIQHADSTTGEDALCAIALKELLSLSLIHI